MTRKYEFHFQEGFDGQRIAIIASGRTLARITAKTRPQTGLAHIEVLQLSAGDQLKLIVEGDARAAQFTLSDTEQYIVINLTANALQVAPSATCPGYL
jgi:hypothetical protein